HAEGTVAIASAVDERWLREYFAAELTEQSALEFDEAGQRAVAVRREVFRGLVLREQRTATRGGAGSAVLLPRVFDDPRRYLDLAPRQAMLLQRIDFARRHGCGDTAIDADTLLRR